jgi:hypothetical protein
LEALFAENVRHTGAVLLVGSGSVNDRELALRPTRVNVPIRGPDANRSPDLDRTRFPGFVIPYVQHRHQRAGLLPGPDFFYADPQRQPNGVVWGTHITAPSCRANIWNEANDLRLLDILASRRHCSNHFALSILDDRDSRTDV